jgi:hypothetical protein
MCCRPPGATLRSCLQHCPAIASPAHHEQHAQCTAPNGGSTWQCLRPLAILMPRRSSRCQHCCQHTLFCALLSVRQSAMTQHPQSPSHPHSLEWSQHPASFSHSSIKRCLHSSTVGITSRSEGDWTLMQPHLHHATVQQQSAQEGMPANNTSHRVRCLMDAA